MEGAPRPTRFHNVLNDTLQILQYLHGWNAQGGEAPPIQAAVASFVPLRSISVIVRLTVDLDRKPRLEAGEIDRITDLRKLPAKLVAAGTPAKLLPEQDFWEAHFPSEVPRALYGHDRFTEHVGAPSTTPLRGAVHAQVALSPGQG